MAGYQNGKLPTEAGRPKHSFNNIHVLTRREKDRNNQTRCKVQVQVQHFTATNMSKLSLYLKD